MSAPDPSPIIVALDTTDIDRARAWAAADDIEGVTRRINGMLYVRGNPLDYNTWAQFGNRGWGYDDVLPYFKKSENFESDADDSRGKGGLLNVSDMRERHEILDGFIDAAAAEGKTITTISLALMD
jgi:choline dehydrogenase-like flavoprotein